MSRLYPSAETVAGRALGAMLRGEAWTSADALYRCASQRLSAAINRLREMGWPVVTRRAEVLTRDAGRRARIGFYSLPADCIEQEGEKGSRFAQTAEGYELPHRSGARA